MTTSLFPRSSGILLHPTSLASPFGIGDLGPAAYEFLDFLEAAGQSLWQVLPLGPTGYGDSPYQCFSAFGGNPLLISLDRLHEQGLLSASDLDDARLPCAANVDFPLVIREKAAALRRAATAFHGSPAFDAFQDRNRRWLADFARFMAFKEQFGMVAWPYWRTSATHPDAEQVRVHTFLQFEFFEQWSALKREANARGIRVMGDIPIYAAGDSSDVWARPSLWKLREDGHPALMAGVPPDYFSATGQLWGNPIYDWGEHAASGYAWWIERFRSTFELFDLVRVDHFRGFQAYFQVPFGETTAVNGEWVEGPGAALFDAVQTALNRRLPVVAENLGVITPEVEAIRNRFGFPGMAILQFAFGKDAQAPDFKPHNYPREVVAYTGTHDNDTVMGWWNSEGGDSTRTAEDIRQEKAFALAYLGADGSEMNWSLIRALMASVADTVVFPVQDLLGLGKQARMNTPATLGGNWKYRMLPGQLNGAIAERLRGFADCYDRAKGRNRDA